MCKVIAYHLEDYLNKFSDLTLKDFNRVDILQ